MYATHATTKKPNCFNATTKKPVFTWRSKWYPCHSDQMCLFCVCVYFCTLKSRPASHHHQPNWLVDFCRFLNVSRHLINWIFRHGINTPVNTAMVFFVKVIKAFWNHSYNSNLPPLYGGGLPTLGLCNPSQYNLLNKMHISTINLTHRPWRQNSLEIARLGRFSNEAMLSSLIRITIRMDWLNSEDC